ncbi:MAG: hypothetical protein LQ350_006360, partial [Teloschistes chrysophthalmus]
MPAAWFHYRNYYTSTPNVGNEGSQSDASPRAGEHICDFGDGITARYTGFLAFAAFMKKLSHDQVQPPRRRMEEELKAGPKDPDRPFMRSQTTDFPAPFPQTELRFGKRSAKGTKAKKQAEKRHAKQTKRQLRREGDRAALITAKASQDPEVPNPDGTILGLDFYQELLDAAGQLPSDVAHPSSSAVIYAENNSVVTSTEDHSGVTPADAHVQTRAMVQVPNKRWSPRGTEYLVYWACDDTGQVPNTWVLERDVNQPLIDAFEAVYDAVGPKDELGIDNGRGGGGGGTRGRGGGRHRGRPPGRGRGRGRPKK